MEPGAGQADTALIIKCINKQYAGLTIPAFFFGVVSKKKYEKDVDMRTRAWYKNITLLKMVFNIKL